MRPRSTTDGGFTLVEILVVIVILGVLAAIAWPVYSSQRAKAWETAVVSDLRNARTAAEAYAAGRGGGYDGLDVAALGRSGFVPTEAVSVTPFPSGETFHLVGSHAQMGQTWRFDSATGVITPEG
ncbi:hypothetical protein GCM10011331_16740 [Flavimobilis marinus]|uniref:Prepilin-type N-terminal cleavage/methylation domain-containing protein n=1 Tax=Flavimobilis marinus TaxID=285351 RepID=A0A1I2FH28_9MICO|nr:prepilin-type N-terminal cleavage/methylation domain-containing protein [Flavimobilis marinus]GHG52245.1 hypothetical protein GCM10011331_16740 [Flavimobilis marinus]SFF03836.1 prepilin-type N-terminal cleavage/methylation domain-containing protein [Flavimobilis marinus]